MNVWEKLQNWYRGTYVPPLKNDPDSSVIMISFGHYNQPFLAKLMGIVGRFWLAHWQWIIGVVLVIVGIWKR